jgi:hypothetical protein
LPHIPGIYNPTDEWLKDHLSGWVEKREEGKAVATIRAHYRVISSPEDKKIVVHEFYAQTTEKHFIKKAEEAMFYNAIYKDIFRTHLSLLTQSLPPSDVLMEILLHFPNHQSELMFIAQVTRVDADSELGRNVYHARLKALAVNQKSITKMIHNMTSHKA